MEKVRSSTPDVVQANIEAIAELFPNVMTESLDDDGNLVRTIDFDQLRQELSDHVVEGPQERYRLDWPGKRAAMLAANAPTRATLRPMLEESVDFENTKNIFIEGDNLEGLKILQESYLGKVKLIYIDPPYNTGNDFIYNDNFAESSAEYLERSGQVDESGTRLVANSESKGRFHSDWLSMMYPRIKLARNLLRRDGFIVVSIDDAEFASLKFLMDEIFGHANELAVLVWDKNRKNDARYFSVGHEYMLVYARDRAELDAEGIRLREPQAGLEEAREFFSELVETQEGDWASIQAAWRKYCAAFPTDDERRKLGRFTKVGPRGPYRDDGDISWPGGGGPKYDVLHPESGLPVKVPSGGWIYSQKASFDEAVASGRVVFGPDETTLPRQVRYLFESPGLVMRSVHFSYAQTSAVEFQKLMGGRVFDNPKNWRDLRRVIEYLTNPDDIVLDFFAGSGSTAHAVLQLNSDAGSSRRFILIQLDEKCDEGSVAAKHGFQTISQLARHRVALVAESLERESGPSTNLDLGFRALRVDSSSYSEVLTPPDEVQQTHLAEMVKNIKNDRSAEDLIFQVIVDAGLLLSLPITRVDLGGKELLDVDSGGLVACFEESLSEPLLRSIALLKPVRAVFCDSSFVSDADRINVEQIFRETSPETQVKVV